MALTSSLREKIRSNKILLFFLKGGLLYLGWIVIYYLLIGPYTSIDENFITHIINAAAKVLRLFGYQTFQETEDRTFQLLGIVGGNNNPGVWIGNACNAITLFALFSIFIVAFPGSTKKKLWFIPMGILIIHTLNILRVCALAMIAYYNYNLLDFNHTYTFTILVYACIFALWFWWVSKFSKTA
jgi:exosortase family protein XrtF